MENPPASSAVRRYRVERTFDDIDRSEFREAAFAAMKEYFRKAIQELEGLEDLRGRFREISATSFGCTVVNRARDRGTAHLTVHARSGDKYGLGDIYYSFEENASPNGAHGSYRVDHDDFEMFLTSQSFGMGEEKQWLVAEAAAEGLWEKVLERAGITYA